MREFVDGKLVEISRNFFAICKRTTSVFYFGEEVDLYKNGEMFKGCLRTQEENPLDQEKEYKIHAPGIGLIQDEGLLLVKFGFSR